MTSILLFGIVIAFFFGAFIFAPKAKLNPQVTQSRVPENLSPVELEDWLQDTEDAVLDLTPGAGACINWANPDDPGKTEMCFLYIHGFSATWQETAPVTDLIAAEFNANVLHARVEGHGVGSDGLLVSAESWLRSVVDSWAIASSLGDKIVIVATSNGASLSVWLAAQEITRDRIHALLLMSPCFKLKSPFGFILTWPWSKYWIRAILGNEINWEPENEMADKYWTSTYSTLCLIEVQKVVDWISKADFSRYRTPLATMYMKNDSTIDSSAAVSGHNRWGSEKKQLIRVTIDGDSEDHVFAGTITAPHRIDWCVNQFVAFLKSL